MPLHTGVRQHKNTSRIANGNSDTTWHAHCLSSTLFLMLGDTTLPSTDAQQNPEDVPRGNSFVEYRHVNAQHTTLSSTRIMPHSPSFAKCHLDARHTALPSTRAR
jgi:hypothetical protein